MDDAADSYALEEYKRLSKIHDDRILEANDVVKYVILACAAVISWVLISKNNGAVINVLGWAVPLVLCLFGWGRDYGINVQLAVVSEYLCKLEVQLGNAQLAGFHNYRDARLQKMKQNNGFIYMTDVSIFWGTTSLICLIMVVVAATS